MSVLCFCFILVLSECTVVGIPIDHETIRCNVGCNDTNVTDISTSSPFNQSRACAVDNNLFPPSTDVTGKLDVLFS